MNERLVPLTDNRGTHLLPVEDRYEPEPGSVVLTEGLHGTAWQRHFADGLWHSTRGGATKTWANLMRKRNLVLVYDADRRAPDQRVRPNARCGNTDCVDLGVRVPADHEHRLYKPTAGTR